MNSPGILPPEGGLQGRTRAGDFVVYTDVPVGTEGCEHLGWTSEREPVLSKTCFKGNVTIQSPRTTGSLTGTPLNAAPVSVEGNSLVVGLVLETDVRRFWDEMHERLREFSLSLHPEKTRLIEFGRHAAVNRKR